MPCEAVSLSCILGRSHDDGSRFELESRKTASEGDCSKMAKKIETKTRHSNDLLNDTEGLTTVEYIIILCLIAVVGFAAWKKFGDSVRKKVGQADTVMNTLPGTSGS